MSLDYFISVFFIGAFFVIFPVLIIRGIFRLIDKIS